MFTVCPLWVSAGGSMYVIVGLGNPGSKYHNTRHNVGFDVIDILAARNNIHVERTKCKAIVGEGIIGGKKAVLCKPQTFMNLSGESVVQLVNWYKPEYDQLIVIYDDVELPDGKVRFRANGSAGTHNGMRNIVQLLGKTDFPRVRVGIGRPPEKWDLKDYVLMKPENEEIKKAMLEGYQKAASAVEVFLKEGLDAVRAFVGR